MGQKTLTGKIAMSKDDYSKLTALAKEGVTSRAEIQRLDNSVFSLRSQIWNERSAYNRLEERYNQLKEKCKPFLQAMEHFPELVKLFVDKVKELFAFKEARGRKEQIKGRRHNDDWER